MISESQVLRLIEQIYDAALEPTLWPVFLDSLSGVFGGTCTSLLDLDLGSKVGSAAYFATRSDPESLRLYGEYYGRLDPWAQAATAQRAVCAGTVHIGDELVPHDQLRKTEYFNDFGRRHHVARIIAATLEVNGPLASVLTVPRGNEAPSFDHHDKKLLMLLVPHLRRALDVERKIAQVCAERDGAHGAMDRLPVAALVLDPTGRAVFVNRAAEAILNKRDGLTLGDRGLAAASARDTRAIAELVRSAAHAASGIGRQIGGVVKVSRPSLREPLVLTIARLRSRDLILPNRAGCAVGVFIHDPEQPVTIDADTLRWMYGMTPTEAAVATDIAAGLTVEQCARSRGVKSSTVRWHLKSVLAKTQTTSQTGLVRLLVRGPAALLTPR